jgi:hypothetical protein
LTVRHNVGSPYPGRSEHDDHLTGRHLDIDVA